MGRATAHKVFWLPAFALCLYLGACAGQEASRNHAAGSSSTTPVAESITGDYDNDDYTNAPYSSDGDNDDSNSPKDKDGDSDNKSGSYYDTDDDAVRKFGKAASAADSRSISALVNRYYTIAVDGDGAAACAMIQPTLARSLPEDIGRPPGPPYLRGDTCAEVMSKIFTLNHKQLSGFHDRLEVKTVRVDGDGGLALLGFGNLPARQIHVAREAHEWRFVELLDGELP